MRRRVPGLRALVGGMALIVLAFPALPQTEPPIYDVLKMGEVVEVLHTEGLLHGENLDRDMLDGSGGRYFADQVRAIYDRDRMRQVIAAALNAGMDAGEQAQTIGFFATQSGQRILDLEISARTAMTDPDVTEIAKQTKATARTDSDPRLAQVDRFIEINDLGERNVAGALSTNFQFLQGLADGGARKMSESEILAQVWQQEDSIRSDTRDWITSFLFMAYSPLTDPEMDAYLDYSVSDAGQALNSAMFDGFDALYRQIYYELGRAVARSMQESEL